MISDDVAITRKAIQRYLHEKYDFIVSDFAAMHAYEQSFREHRVYIRGSLSGGIPQGIFEISENIQDPAASAERLLANIDDMRKGNAAPH